MPYLHHTALKKQVITIASRVLARRVKKDSGKAIMHQHQLFHELIYAAKNTAFGIDHGFTEIKNHQDFITHVPLVNYHGLQPYIDRIRDGNASILWPGKPLYLAKTSGTTGDYKYIPISKKSMPHHIKAARNALACYINQSGNVGFINGKMLFLQGSPVLENINGLLTGRLSGIVANHVPRWLRANRLPTYATNTITDWNLKEKSIVEETLRADMRLFGGIPSWLQHYFEALLHTSGKQHLAELYPHLQVLVHGGVDFTPYRKKFESLFGKPVDVIETYPATEGFIAWQDNFREKGLLLNTNAGMFFEFIAMEDLEKNPGKRIALHEVELNKNYALVLNTNSGLFGYLVGDTVLFVSKDPYKIVVTGRIKEYVSAFGEQVYAHQTDTALKNTMETCGGLVNEYHVSPVLGQNNYHQWLIEFEKMPADINAFETMLDRQMHTQNIFYRDIVLTGVISPLKISVIEKNGFYKAMQKAGRLGEQNKVPRLASNDGFASLFRHPDLS